MKITTTSTNDNRSYHISSSKIAEDINFVPAHTIEDAVSDLKDAFDKGLIPDSLEDPRYFNVKLMKGVELK